MKKPVIINGFGGVGKDTFVSIVAGKTRTNTSFNIITESYSSVDIIKQVAKTFGWDGVSKTEKDRRFLYDLKKLVTDYNDGCLKYMKECYEKRRLCITLPNNEHISYLIFFHIREPKEIDKAKEALDAICIYVKNDNVPRNEHNLEDKDIENYPYDYIVNNSGTLEDLELEADKFINWIKENYFKGDNTNEK